MSARATLRGVETTGRRSQRGSGTVRCPCRRWRAATSVAVAELTSKRDAVMRADETVVAAKQSCSDLC